MGLPFVHDFIRKSLDVQSTKSHRCTFWLHEISQFWDTFRAFSKVFETCCLLQCGTSILVTFVHLISDITLQRTGCFRRPRWFGGNESNRRKFTVPSKWVKKNKKRCNDTMRWWDYAINVPVGVFHNPHWNASRFPTIGPHGCYIYIFLAHLVVVRSVQWCSTFHRRRWRGTIRFEKSSRWSCDQWRLADCVRVVGCMR